MPIKRLNAEPGGLPEDISHAGRWRGWHGIGDPDCTDVLFHSVSGGCDNHDGRTAVGDARGSDMEKGTGHSLVEAIRCVGFPSPGSRVPVCRSPGASDALAQR
jgi:hypothetical protein